MTNVLRTLDLKKRTILHLFKEHHEVTTLQISKVLKLKPRTVSILCRQWVDEGFLEIENPSNKNRTYRLAPHYEEIIVKK